MSRYLAIVEVSQKQSYIFSSNKLKDNIKNSWEIAHITSVEYIGISESNLVYTGGGHTIMEFETEDDAKEAIQEYTLKAIQEYPDIELFAKVLKYDDTKTPGENIKLLTAALEKKKSVRKSSFHQGTFGIEKIDTNTGKAIRRDKTSAKKNSDYTEKFSVPGGFAIPNRFEDLGGSKHESNFIAVIHIDGNAMGKRVENLSSKYKVGEWDSYKKQMRNFSEGIARDFANSFEELQNHICDNIMRGNLSPLASNVDRENQYYVPIRPIILEGDDVCFVTDGRIGIESAAYYLQQLAGKVNDVDGLHYSACAGVAIVHQKYPFYRAYELAEELCSNAKKLGATLDKDNLGAGVSSIDWHIEYGEMQDSLEETRKDYLTRDGKNLEMRPYLVCAGENVYKKEPYRKYEHFKTLINNMLSKEEFYGRGILKEIRPVLKKGEIATRHYLRYHKIESLARDSYQGIFQAVDYEKTEIGSGKELERKAFLQTEDGKERSLLFDAVEMMDTYLTL